VLFVNRAAEELFGRSSGSLLGQDFGFAVVDGETAEMDIVRQGEPAVGELRVTATRWEGMPAQIVSVRDITDRKRAEDRAHRLVLEQSAREQAEREGRRASFLAEAGKLLDASLDPQVTLVSLSQLIVPRMADWCVVDIVEGDTIRRIAGIHSDPEKQLLLEELHRRYPPAAGSAHPASSVIESGVAELHRELNGERLEPITIDEEHAGLLRQLGIRSSITAPLRARNKLLGAITIVCNEKNLDASDLELLEEVASRAGQALENARLYEAAVSASKARSDFLAVVSHELRTPLNAILGYTQLLLEGITEDPDTRLEQLHRIDASATDLLHIIQKILMFASMEAARIEPDAQDVHLGELMDGVAAVAGPLARDHGLEFGLQVRDPDAQLFTDPGKLRQITLDLLTNAVKFTDHGRIDLACELRDGDLVIAVRDTGVGITSEHMEKIFEPFWQAEEALTRHAGGMGLGLTVSRRLARLLGGDITVVSEPHAGSTFTLRVPARIAAGTEHGDT
jgi:signal transduction histidine kinase